MLHTVAFKIPTRTTDFNSGFAYGSYQYYKHVIDLDSSAASWIMLASPVNNGVRWNLPRSSTPLELINTDTSSFKWYSAPINTVFDVVQSSEYYFQIQLNERNITCIVHSNAIKENTPVNTINSYLNVALSGNGISYTNQTTFFMYTDNE